MFNPFSTAAREIAAAWRTEAAARKARTPSDPAAETLVSCATELEDRVAAVERSTAYLSVYDFAQSRGLSPSTVRRLCLVGELEGAEKDITGEWRIPHDARRVRRTLMVS